MTIAAKCLSIGCSRLTKKPGGFCWQHWDMGQPSTTAPIEQTEAQDDGPMGADFTGKLLDWTQGRNEEYRAEIESLRAQLEAARRERDALQRNATAWKSVAESRELEMHSLRADLAQKMQEHQDALSEMRGRMEWVMRHISGKAWREAGIEYGQVEDIPGLIDAALSPPIAGAV